MKKKLSISIDEKTIIILDSLIVRGNFRNKSHLVESAINQFIEGARKNAI